jgi:hypothetical protein
MSRKDRVVLGHTESGGSQYRLSECGAFSIADYNSAKPFSSFLPGIAGVDGIPMWVFYVNRGQCVCSMGIRDKDHAMMEFLPANWAYQLVGSQGFRTFIRLLPGASAEYHEPFRSDSAAGTHGRTQRMDISPAQLTLQEVEQALNLKFTVDYSTVPQDRYAGLIRRLRIENLNAHEIALEGLDGLPVLVPYGVDNYGLKNMRRTIEAFVEVRNLDRQVPFFKAKVEPADRPDVREITRGHFYVGFETDGTAVRLATPVVDPVRVFGRRNDFGLPERFLAKPADAVAREQRVAGQFPCAMGMFRATIPKGGVYTYYSIIGHASSLSALNEMIPRIAAPAYVEERAAMNQILVDTLTQHSLICSAEPALDLYARQNFLDNAMRGGFPLTFQGSSSHTTLHLFSRKHGDLERDYNDFRLMPTPCSQGNGNFRDINQNRRCDLFFNPDVAEANVEHFYNLIQLDGFNPLVLGEVRFSLADGDRAMGVLERFIPAGHLQAVTAHLEEGFTPGSLLAFLGDRGISLSGESETFLGRLLEHCSSEGVTDHGEGYWIDHWTYNLDLLENYLAVYPDRFGDLLFGDGRFSFYDSPHRVEPRSRKYVLWQKRPAQLGAVVLDGEKAAILEKRDSPRNLVRTDFGKGEVYRTSLFVKILGLIVNKLSSLDPEGLGVEMEAGKPGWYDALNGLPGLFGSSVCETLETKRHILFLLEHFPTFEAQHDKLAIFEEQAEFLDAMHELLGSNVPAFEFWDRASSARERFREQTRLGISGRETTVAMETVRDFLSAALGKLDRGIERSWDPQSRTILTYFRHEVTDYEVSAPAHSQSANGAGRDADEVVRITPTRFRSIPLPLFLEGPVHYLRCRPGAAKARELAASIKANALFDRSLKMYKVNAPLTHQPMEIGRAKVFPAGWLENESVWLHMEYKYLLELLRNDLYEEFFADFRTVLVPFMQPDAYGRSILENCSFIASSAHPDPCVHGNGFVARLSGATAEFIHMLALVSMGPRPFGLNASGELELALKPALPGWLFTTKPATVRLAGRQGYDELQLPAASFSFMFLGTILVVYHNEGRKDTYGASGVMPVAWMTTDPDGNSRNFEGPTLKGDVAGAVRDRRVARIDVTLR